MSHMKFIRPDVIKTPISNNAWGFPFRGSRRRLKPTQLAILHITGNARTAGYDNPRKGTRAEIAYMGRAGSSGPSAHTYVSRDGALFQCINAKRFAAWSNGDLIVPDTSKPYVREMVRKAPRYNANELVYREYEMTGGGKYQVTRKQLEAVAYQIARDSIATGLPIKPLVTVGIHAHINTINRRNDPFRDKRVQRIEALCERAQEWKRHIKRGEPIPDPPDPEPPDPVPPDEKPDVTDQLAEALGRIEAMEVERDAMLAALDTIGQATDPYFDWEEEP